MEYLWVFCQLLIVVGCNIYIVINKTAYCAHLESSRGLKVGKQLGQIMWLAHGFSSSTYVCRKISLLILLIDQQPISMIEFFVGFMTCSQKQCFTFKSIEVSGVSVMQLYLELYCKPVIAL